MLLNIVKYSLRVQNFFRYGRVQGGTGSRNVNLDTPKISETTRARMLKLKTQLDIVEVLALCKKNYPLGASRGRRAP